ncbi:Holliday junction endonuclease [Embleya sp. NPDC005971]|uniref:Holliday junction endonuclease n=1 Tax=Embleya sp. NPDC005971 TaxID=3156724 RepID=UPI00340C794A
MITPPRVIGLDPSVTATGIAWHDGSTTTAGGPATQGDSRLEEIVRWAGHAACYHPNRLRRGEDGEDLRAHLAVLEDLPVHGKGAGITGMAQGVVRLTLLDCSVPYALVTAAGLKKYATGRGNADKADMRMALYQRTGLDLRDDNQVDAWWLRAMGLDHLGYPVVELPAAQRAMLDKVTWPEAATS